MKHAVDMFLERGRVSSVTSAFSFSHTSMQHPVTLIDDGLSACRNFCRVQKKRTSDLSGFRRRSISQNHRCNPAEHDFNRSIHASELAVRAV